MTARQSRAQGRLYGQRGQKQQGIDLYVLLPVTLVEGHEPERRRYLTLQSRRIASVTAAGLRKAVTDFLAGDWAAESLVFVYATSDSGVRTQLANEIRKQTARLGRQGINFEVWDAEVLAEQLRKRHRLVYDFFGSAWLEAFAGAGALVAIGQDAGVGSRHSVAPPGVIPALADPALAGLASQLMTSRSVEQWNPFDLDIHPAITVENCAGLPDLPPYVRRPHDDELDAVLGDVTVSLMVVVTGGSSTGKTRACYEALTRHRTLKDWPLIYPRTPAELITALTSSWLGPRSVLWLNETQNLLTGPEGETVAVLLRRVLDGTLVGPLVMVGTLWPEHWERFVAHSPPAAAGADEYLQVRQLLTHAVRRVRVSPLTDDQVAALVSGTSTDPRLKAAAEAARDNKVIQVLAGGPQLLQRYGTPETDDARFGATIVKTAIVSRGLGYQAALSDALLSQAAPGFLKPEECDEVPDDWAVRGFRDATTRVHGISALTKRHTPGRATTDGYLPHPYLDQHLGPAWHRVLPPISLWDALAAYASDQADRVRLARTADSRALFRHAALLAIPAADTGDAQAMSLLAAVLARAGKDADAERWLRRAAEGGDEHATQQLAALWRRTGRPPDAEPWLRKIATSGNTAAMSEMVDLLNSRDQDAGVRWLRELADSGNIDAIWHLCGILDSEECRPWVTRAAEQGDLWALSELAETVPADAERWLRRAAEAGDVDAMTKLSALLDDADLADEAERWARRAAEAGDDNTIWWFGERLLRRGETAAAADWLQRVHTSDPEETQEVAALLESAGGADAAERWLRNEASRDWMVTLSLATWLREHDRSADADQLLHEEVEDGNLFAWMQLESVMLADGRQEEAEQILRHRAELGDVHMMTELAAALQRGGSLESAQQWWHQAAEAGDLAAIRHLADDMERRGRVAEAEQLLRRMTESGASDGLNRLAQLLTRTGRAEEAQRLLRFGIEADGATSTEW